ncbi:MAG: Asp-tRNA(Asn)/Glu-tRNA(Gln) amidotransferase subunit GatA [Hydrogenothermaceae bacterium]|nr:Asp-tRNA(Asn)/Glu-tRNA(Gln) amidotransferase subunit GatA [Hydrogenothermaceae bacterium]
MELWKRSLVELSSLVRSKEVKPSEIVQAFIERKNNVEKKIKAYVTVTDEIAMEEAKKKDDDVVTLQTIPTLFGLPIAIKDNISTKGIRTTCSSKMLENFVPVFDATVVERLKESGYIITGKTNLDEFAMGSSTENSAFFTTRNPWDLERVPGGSSGGSAATVASGMVPASLGSDTGGSIRQPAAFCGVVGLKPTYGRVSRYGLVAFASSLDQIGPITRTVEDAALMMNIIAGRDHRDSTSKAVPVPNYLDFVGREINGLKIGIPKEFFPEDLDSQIRDILLQMVKRLEGEGATVEEISLPNTKYAIETYYIIAPSEASSNLARFDGVRYGYRAKDYTDIDSMYAKTRDEGFGTEVKRRIMVGTYVLSSGYYDAYYLKAQKVRTLIYQDFMRAFEKVDVIITPTTPDVAFKIGEKSSDPIQMYLSDIFTVSINLATLPAISVPCGLKEGLPVGLQVIGRPFDEGSIISVADRVEKISQIYRIFPNV